MTTDVDIKLVPRHVAIIMDGNGRWARRLGKSRQYGHRAGSGVVHDIANYASRRGIKVLTLFAFSSENWKRPRHEVSFLLELFIDVLKKELDEFDNNNVCFRVIGDRTHLPTKLKKIIQETEDSTADNQAITLQVAFSYGGRWDITHAAKVLAERVSQGAITSEAIDEELLAKELSFSDLPDVDLLIRTGGDIRISNFVLWQAAYAELYFTDVLWPDFSPDELEKAIHEYSSRQRRFGLTGDQVNH